MFHVQRLRYARHLILRTCRASTLIPDGPAKLDGTVERGKEGTRRSAPREPSAPTNPPRGCKSPFLTPLIRTGSRRNPATCGTNQGSRQSGVATASRAGGPRVRLCGGGGQAATSPDWWQMHSHIYPTPYARHPTPYILNPTPCTLNPTPFSLQSAPYTLHPTTLTLNSNPHAFDPEPDPAI